ncbi:hypothetical protein [Demequina rhizosphaerae]|uniref:hypothetical protein n=1 Tax=Demequina rhizosphaerae TaxID=1638985 RepID=UPI000A602B90|nr:hypothetical protein [Demequina rhizosphaerae]
MVHTAEGAARRFIARDVRAVGAALDPSGLRMVRLDVADESDGAMPLGPDEHPSPVSPGSFAEWAARLGTPAALPNIYLPSEARLSRPDGDDMFTGPELDEHARRYLTAATDARALRVRGRVLQWIALRSAVDVAGTLRWASLSCGPAFPVVAAIAGARDVGATVAATFVDTCTDALDASRRVALAHGVDPGDHRFVSIEDQPASPAAVVEPASQHLVEALALLSTVTPDEAPAALADAYALVRPGGTLVFSVMLDDRPPCAGCAALGWPTGPTLDLAGVADLLAAAGIPCEDALALVPQDGIYAVVQVERP